MGSRCVRLRSRGHHRCSRCGYRCCPCHRCSCCGCCCCPCCCSRCVRLCPRDYRGCCPCCCCCFRPRCCWHRPLCWICRLCWPQVRPLRQRCQHARALQRCLRLRQEGGRAFLRWSLRRLRIQPRPRCGCHPLRSCPLQPCRSLHQRQRCPGSLLNGPYYKSQA